MTVERIQLLRNIGQFDSVTAGAQIALTPLTLTYAENGRGKTTLAAVLKSLGTGDARLIEDRKRLGASLPPHIVIAVNGGQTVYQNGAWPAPVPQIAVFDDAFVAANVCSGIEIESSHRQNLHELILGEEGVALNADLQREVTAIEQHNRDLRLKEAAIPAGHRSGMTVDAFCALAPDDEIDAHIQAAERNLAAARSADAIRQRDAFQPLSLPAFDLDAIRGLLARTLPDVQADATARVRAHLRQLGKGGEGWIGEGMARVATASEGRDVEVCPFCAQDLSGSEIVSHYDAYFSDAYTRLKSEIIETGQGLSSAHGGEVQAAFERDIRLAIEARQFWQSFLEVPEIEVDTAAFLRAWTPAREAVLSVLRTKAASPLEAVTLGEDAIRLVGVYQHAVSELGQEWRNLLATNPNVARVKEQAAAANPATLANDLETARATEARHTPPLKDACDDYVAEKAAKAATEARRVAARAALDRYRQVIFPAYEQSINDYLGRFNAGFRLGSVGSTNTRAGSSATYNVVINNMPVGLTAANGGPSFRTALSAGDRNTLALAFFFASLEHGRDLQDKIVVIDDPMTSLDEHRSLATIQEVLALIPRVRQVIILSHSRPFLCALWREADTQTRSAFRISRDGAGSTLADWDVRQDSITHHDRRHAMVRDYVLAANPANERAVAEALRPILEAYTRVAYPEVFPPDSLLGRDFLPACRQRLGQGNELLNVTDIAELEQLLAYANRFHHDSNPAWQTEVINDQELTGFARRALRFASRG